MILWKVNLMWISVLYRMLNITQLDRVWLNVCSESFIFFKLFLEFYLLTVFFFFHILNILQSIFVCNAILIQYFRSIFFSFEKLFKYHKRILFYSCNLLTVINTAIFGCFLLQHLSFIPRVITFYNIHPCMRNAYLDFFFDFGKFILMEDFVLNIKICKCPVSSLLKEGLCT